MIAVPAAVAALAAAGFGHFILAAGLLVVALAEARYAR